MEAVALMDSLEHPEICLRSAYQSYKDVLGCVWQLYLGSPAISVQVKVRFVARPRRGMRHKAEPDGAVD
jgi:hypothetical protein